MKLKLEGIVLLCSLVLIIYSHCWAVELPLNGKESLLHQSNKSKLQCGAGKVEIEIPEKFFPYTSFRGRKYTGIRDTLSVRTIIVANVEQAALFISIDTGDLSDEWLTEISDASGVAKNAIFLTATHTHESPYISRSMAETTLKDVEKSRLFAKNTKAALFKAIKIAKESMTDCKIGFGTGFADVNVNRNFKLPDGEYIIHANPRGISDKTVVVTTFVSDKGVPLASLFNYAVHSVVLFNPLREEGMRLSGDLAGEAARYVEEKTGKDFVCIFTMAPAADQNARYMSAYEDIAIDGTRTQVDLGDSADVLLRVQAEELGGEVLRIAQDIDNWTAASRIVSLSRQISVQTNGKEGMIDPLKLQCGLILIGDIAFIGFPGEIVTSVGERMKESFQQAGYDRAMVITQCNGSYGYFSDDSGYKKQTFDAKASFASPGYDEQYIGIEKEMLMEIDSQKK